jgi:hypothetical protein
MDLLTTYIHNLELQANTVLSLIYTLYKSLEHTPSLLSAFTSHFLVTDLNNGDSSASVVTPLSAGSLHNSQITTAPAKPFPVCCVFASRSLTTASNSGYSSASCAQVLSSQPCVQNSTELIALIALIITPGHRPHRKHRSSVVAFMSIAARMCSTSCCPERVA